MEPQALAQAQATVKSFTAQPQPHDAIAVAVPPGGWDDAATPAAPTAHGKARSATPPGSYKVGKR